MAEMLIRRFLHDQEQDFCFKTEIKTSEIFQFFWSRPRPRPCISRARPRPSHSV